MTKRIISIALAILMLASIFVVGTVSSSAASKTKSYSHTYHKDDYNGKWVTKLTVKSLTKIKFVVKSPVHSNGKREHFSFDITDSKGKFWLTEYENTNKKSYTYYAYLAKGKYTINYYAYYIFNYSYTKASFKATFQSKWKVPKPKLVQKAKVIPHYTYTEFDTDLAWDQSNANYRYDYDGVDVYIKSGGKWSKEKTVYTSPRSYTYDTSLFLWDRYSTHYCRVRAYKELKNGKKVYSKYSSTLNCAYTYRPSAPKINYGKSLKKKTATIKWKKVIPAKGYIIYRSTNSSTGFKKVGKTSKLKFTDKKVKRGKTYYYRVKNYCKVKKSTLISNFSAAKKIKVK